MGLREQPALALDGLYCEEECFEDEDFGGIISGDVEKDQIHVQNVIKQPLSPFLLLEDDFFWEESELDSLISKEKETHLGLDGVALDGSLMVARREAIGWILRVKAHYGFNALTGVLAVNYFDRFISSLRFQKDKPWMAQITAVACLSLAAKVEETHVPLLLDLQVEESRFVFEAKTIKRMELLVLSTLLWRMNPVTPISFFDYIVRRLGLNANLNWDFLTKCELLLLSVIADSRVMSCLPSVLATAIMLHVIEDVGPGNQVECQNQLVTLLKISQDKVNECYRLILGQLSSKNEGHECKNPSIPFSPSGVIDAIYSSGSSNDSWSAVSIVSSSPATRFKRHKTQDQQMWLPAVNRTFVDVLSGPP